METSCLICFAFCVREIELFIPIDFVFQQLARLQQQLPIYYLRIFYYYVGRNTRHQTPPKPQPAQTSCRNTGHQHRPAELPDIKAEIPDIPIKIPDIKAEKPDIENPNCRNTRHQNQNTRHQCRTTGHCSALITLIYLQRNLGLYSIYSILL